MRVDEAKLGDIIHILRRPDVKNPCIISINKIIDCSGDAYLFDDCRDSKCSVLTGVSPTWQQYNIFIRDARNEINNMLPF